MQGLLDTRVILHPADMVHALEMMVMSPEAVGAFFRMLPYLVGAKSLRKDWPALGRMASVHVRTIRRLWPELQQVVAEDDAWVWLRPLPWLHVQRIPVDRQRLRHLLDRLVSFWGNACVYCGTDEGVLEIEHIVPVVRGGTDDLTNLTLACKACNLRKRTQTAAEFGHPHIHELAAKIH